jgi:hypothetical protein
MGGHFPPAPPPEMTCMRLNLFVFFFSACNPHFKTVLTTFWKHVHGAQNIPICVTLSPTSIFVALRQLVIFGARKKGNGFRRAIANVCHWLRVKDTGVWQSPFLLLTFPVMGMTKLYSLFACIYIYIYIYIMYVRNLYMYVRMYIWLRAFICTYEGVYVCIYAYMCAYVYGYMYVCRPMCISKVGWIDAYKNAHAMYVTYLLRIKARVLMRVIYSYKCLRGVYVCVCVRARACASVVYFRGDPLFL